MKNVYTCFPQGKFKVLTMSYDDGKCSDERLVEIFNKYKIKGTFHINGGLIGQKSPTGNRLTTEQIKTLYKGHEIAAHTYTHPTISRCPISTVALQILEDRKILEDMVGSPVRGLSYPNGSYSKEICDMLPALGIEYSRVVEETGKFDLPTDLYRWKATCHHEHNLIGLAKEFLSLSKSQYLYMFYVWGHSIEFDKNNNWNMIEEFCKMVSDRDDIWYATNIEYVDYINVKKNLKFTAKGDIVYNPSASSAWLNVEGDIIEVKGGTQIKLF